MPAKAPKKTFRSTTAPALRVGLIEDSAVTSKMLRQLIEGEPGMEFVGAWSTGEEAIAQVAKLRPAVMLIDLDLPGISGEDCLKALSGLLPAAALLVLTTHDDPARVFASLQAGAHGYLLKNNPPGELIAAIRAACAGGSPLSPAVAALVIQAFKSKAEPKPKQSLPLPSLSPRELQILQLFAQSKVPKEAAAELNLSYETVRDYIKQIYRKLHVRSRTEAVLRYLESEPAAPPAS